MSQLAARKVSGSGSDVTIIDVSCTLLSCCAWSRSTFFGSYASGATLEDGHAMFDARRLWNLPRSCRQGKSACFPKSTISCGGFFYIRKSLFAYHIEALVPTSPLSLNTPQTPQKLNGSKDVHFFRVGNLGGRTLVIYMKKKGVGFCSTGLVLESIL